MIETMAICATDRIAHRVAGAAGFAYLLQETTVEDRFEAQPILGAGGDTLLVTDAMLDNREELTRALGWTTGEAALRPDSALVQAAWERWGEACPLHLEGAFALVVWQAREQRLFCAVDHFNFRPLYYWRAGPVFAFASTLKGLFSLPGVSREIDETVFAESFVGLRRLDSEATLYRAIGRVPPAHTLRVDARGAHATRYWRPWPAAELRLRSDGEYEEAFRAEFTRAVRVCLRSRRGVGIMLSGGLDSSAVAAYAAPLLAAKGRRLQAFHTLPEAASRYDLTPGLTLDESDFVRAFQATGPAIDFHLQVHRPSPTAEVDWEKTLADECVPVAGQALTEDPAWTELVARANLGVLLDGLGGNFLVSVETRPNSYLAHLLARGRWLTLLREFRGHCRTYGAGAIPLWRDTLREAGWLSAPPSPLPPAFHLLHPALRHRLSLADRLREQEEKWRSVVVTDFRGLLAYIMREFLAQNIGVAPSIIGRTHTIMGRSPMMDRRLNEFCLSLPVEQHIRDGWDRLPLRQATRGLLPEAVRLRTSRGLPQPEFQQGVLRLRDSLRRQAEALDSRSEQWFNVAEFRRVARGLGTIPLGFDSEQALTNAATWARFFTTSLEARP